MSLKARLDTLRRQAGGETDTRGTVNKPAGVALRERLARVGAERRDAAMGCARRVEPMVLAQLLGGELVAERVVCVETHLPLPQHPEVRPARATLAQNLPGLGALPVDDAVFVDTETSGLAGGTGTVAYLVGLAQVCGGTVQLRQYLMTGFGAEADMLAAVSDALDDRTRLVTYNGKSFDVPLLKDRFRLARQAHPLERVTHVDLLHSTRRLFRGIWPDCRLATAEQRLLGWSRVDDLPGSQAPQVWLDLLRHGETARLPAVFHHNRLDLLSLTALWPALADAHAEPGAWGACALAAALAWYRSGDEATARRVLAAEPSLTPAGDHELARLYRRAGDWEAACRIWRRLAGSGDVGAVEALAKYHEHVRRDWRAAIDCAGRLPPELASTRRRRLRLARKRACHQRDLFG